MANFLRGVREWATPVLQTSAFTERGVLTPEEFVAAGDQLVYRCPTWQWAAGEPGKLRPHLPADKQYLVTRGVPCRERASALANAFASEVDGGGEGDGEGGGDEGWLDTHVMSAGSTAAAGASTTTDELDTIGDFVAVDDGTQRTEVRPEDVGEIVGQGAAAGGLDLAGAIVDEHFTGGGGGGSALAEPDTAAAPADEYEDMATFEEDNIAQPDEATLSPATGGYMVAEEPEDTVVRTRVYDLSITYDKYYQTPRVWLFGYDELGQPLTPEQTFEDVIQDYARRTVTIDPHPHLSALHASVHPCKHANVMKRIVDNLVAGGSIPRTDQYLFIFLKFIGSVVPTIEYDYTMEVSAS